MKKIYFDIAATTPIDPQVIAHMNKIQESVFGNPSSIHRFGQEARATIERSRRQVANALSCMPKEVIFTGSGSESNNIVLQGCLNKGDHLITSSYEHPAILKVAAELQKKGVEVTYIKPDDNGLIVPDNIKKNLRKNTKLISIMYVNNEIGSINPIKEITDIAHKNNVSIHTDAVQYFGKHLIDVSNLKVDFVSLSGHKFYGPKGVGALYKKHTQSLTSTIQGGGQESNLRPGTENIAGIAGFGLAAELSQKHIEKNISKIEELEQLFLQELDRAEISYRLNGKDRLNGIMNITFFDISGQKLLMNLDLRGVAISYGSACSSGSMKESQILLETKMPKNEAKNTVRISVGKIHTFDEVKYTVNAISDIISNKND